MELIERRDTATLMAVISANPNPFTFVYTDSGELMVQFLLENPFFEHQTEKHWIKFVNSVDGAYTHSIESSWGALKRFKWRKSYSKEQCLHL